MAGFGMALGGQISNADNTSTGKTDNRMCHWQRSVWLLYRIIGGYIAKRLSKRNVRAVNR